MCCGCKSCEMREWKAVMGLVGGYRIQVHADKKDAERHFRVSTYVILVF